MSDNTMNPMIMSVTVGIRELKEKTIYPLSVSDQMKVTDLIGTVIDSIADDKNIEGLSDVEIIKKFAGSIETNISEILGYVTDPKDPISLDDIDNNQLSVLLDCIFTVNYEGSAKNLKALWERAKGLFPSAKQLQK